MNKGVLLAVGAYLLWGVLPLYMKALQAVAPLEILAHRVVWSVVLLFAVLAFRQHWHWLPAVLRQPKTLLTFVLTSTLLSVNWLAYIWAVHHHRVVEASLGYFINPLISVVLGVVFLHERLRFWQMVAVGIATSAVLLIAIMSGTIPWVALIIAFSFGGYGLLRKTATLNSLEGLSLETLLLFPFALFFLVYQEKSGVGAFGHLGANTTILLMFSGVITAVPLLLFAAGARLIPLSTLGILQYFAPSLQFAQGVLLFGEIFTPDRLVGFTLIWLALAVYSLEGLLDRRRGVTFRYAS